MSRSTWYQFCSDKTVQSRLDRVCRQPLPAGGTANRKEIAELDQLAEIMIGRPTTDQRALKVAIQTEVLRRGPDRGKRFLGQRSD